MQTILMLFLFFGITVELDATDSEANNPVFNLDPTALEKNIAAIFNKVAHSSATTKRSVPAYEAQISQSTMQSTTPSQAITSFTTSLMSFPTAKATNPPHFRELPSYAPPPRALFTPPLPPEYANPFADKPTLRGTNLDGHLNARRPIPPPSLTPLHERIPIKPPDLIEDTTKSLDRPNNKKERVQDSLIKDALELSDRDSNLNSTINFVPSLHFTSISRILSGSNGKKQDIPEILLKPIPTKPPQNQVITKIFKNDQVFSPLEKSAQEIHPFSTDSTIVTQQYKTEDFSDTDEFYETWKKDHEVDKTQVINTDDSRRYQYPQTHIPALPSKRPSIFENVSSIQISPVKLIWKVAWSLHVYITATLFTLIALFSVYKIVRYNDATNLLTQSYFLAIHLLLTLVCTLRCFYLFYDAYNLGHSLPEVISRILMFLPSSLLTAAFATLILFMSRCSTSLHQSRFSNPAVLILAFIIHITLCISLHLSSHVIGFNDESKILPLICRCIYIVICVTLGLCYMYVYRVIRSQLNFTGSKSINDHVSNDVTISSLNTAITTTFSTALLFILMGFLQLYGIFGVPVRLQPYAPVWWGWEFSVRITELTMCSLLAWVSSLSQFHLREKQIQQHVINSGFALFPCGNSTSTENIDDALYPAICSTNQAIQNYTLRTGKHVYDDSFPLNTLPDHFNVANTFERHSTKKSNSLGHFSETHHSFGQQRRDNSEFLNFDSRTKHNSKQDVLEYSSASGSTMLVAEDGFVRFRNLGLEDNDLLSKKNSIRTNTERRNSTSYSDRFDVKQSTIIAHKTQNSHQNSLPHLSSNHLRNHQLYNNT